MIQQINIVSDGNGLFLICNAENGTQLQEPLKSGEVDIELHTWHRNHESGLCPSKPVVKFDEREIKGMF